MYTIAKKMLQLGINLTKDMQDVEKIIKFH